MQGSVSIAQTTNGRLPSLPFSAYKNAILGKRYELSVAFVNAARMRALNARYRGIDTPTDILSFPLSKTAGEIFICLAEARNEAKKFERTYENFLPFLFIHGCVHLAGYDHGRKMEALERKYRRRFGV